MKSSSKLGILKPEDPKNHQKDNEHILFETTKDETIRVTLMSGSNPMIIINSSSLNLIGSELPSEINYDKIKEKISKIKFLSYETILHVTSYYAFPIKWK